MLEAMPAVPANPPESVVSEQYREIEVVVREALPAAPVAKPAAPPVAPAAPPAAPKPEYQPEREQYHSEQAPDVTVTQQNPQNVNVSIRINSPGDDGPVTQTNNAVVVPTPAKAEPPSASPGGGPAAGGGCGPTGGGRRPRPGRGRRDARHVGVGVDVRVLRRRRRPRCGRCERALGVALVVRRGRARGVAPESRRRARRAAGGRHPRVLAVDAGRAARGRRAAGAARRRAAGRGTSRTRARTIRRRRRARQPGAPAARVGSILPLDRGAALAAPLGPRVDAARAAPHARPAAQARPRDAGRAAGLSLPSGADGPAAGPASGFGGAASLLLAGWIAVLLSALGLVLPRLWLRRWTGPAWRLPWPRGPRLERPG